ncbi:phage head closure protein [Ornithinibacillus xuwenensis]|uniref:Phage head closure protein n=1 Tax=Ornithinibacillus xuwenensis TaxID=3144668 RepID=A0ABU9XC58_9BACI
MDEFPHTIIFQELTEVDDGYGGYTEQWIDLITTEANVQPINSDQQIQAQQLTSPIDHNIFYPFREGVTDSMRVLWNGKTLVLRSKPLDQGGMGEILLVKAELK